MLFTQNIDCLEREAGVPGELIVEAHGSFAEQRCVDCKKPFPAATMKEHVFKGEVPRCADKTCMGLVKPDIVFFGEQLPEVFHKNRHVPATGDLTIVMGTSLTVHPFAGLPDVTGDDTPRVLFNLEQVGSLGTRPDDVLVLGDCDSGVRKLADELGWRDELEALWRDVVGEKEAERQLRSAEKRGAELQSEVEDLADRVGEGLKLDEGTGGRDVTDTEGEDDALEKAHDTPAVASASDKKDKLVEIDTPSTATQEVKDDPPSEAEAKSGPLFSEHKEEDFPKPAAVDGEPNVPAQKADAHPKKLTAEDQEDTKEPAGQSSPEATVKPTL